MIRIRSWLLGAWIVSQGIAGLAAPLAAQDRDELIRQAEAHYGAFETERALDVLKVALDPTKGEPDSAWAEAVHLLAAIYLDEGEPELARLWLRWAMREFPTMRVDRDKLSDALEAVSDSARAWVRRTQGDGDFVTRTWFEWPAGRIVPATGSLRIDPSGLGVPLVVLVRGGDEPQGRRLREGVTATLDPGTYEIEASAEGYVVVHVTRVVLPGVTTVLGFDLLTFGAVAAGAPALTEPLLSRVRSPIVRLSLWRFGRGPTCGSGFYAASSYAVTTYDAIEGADSVVAMRGDRLRIENRVIRVAAVDTAANLAVLKLPTHADSLSLAPTLPRRGEWVFPLAFTDCNTGLMNDRGVRVALGDDPIELVASTAGAQLGAAVVDTAGAVVGLAYRGDRAIPAATIAAVLDEARRRDRAGQLLTLDSLATRYGLAPQRAQPVAAAEEKKGGFPVMVVVGALAAAGGAAALLLLGGKSDSLPPPPGGITITYPNR